MNTNSKMSREVPAQRKVEITSSGAVRQFEAGGAPDNLCPIGDQAPAIQQDAGAACRRGKRRD